MAAFLAIAMLLLAMTGHASSTWCVCKEMADSALQKTLDYACGAGADCNPTRQNGPCFLPNTVRAHCSYAVNSYFQKKGQAQGTCDFSGTATISTSDPSINGCAYPATSTSSSGATGSGITTPTPVTPTTGTRNTTTTTPTSTTPYTATPSNGVVGGIGNGNGVSPTGAGINTDMSDGGLKLDYNGLFLFASCWMHLWG